MKPATLAPLGATRSADGRGVGLAEGVEFGGVDRAGDEQQVERRHWLAPMASVRTESPMARMRDLVERAAGGLSRRGAGPRCRSGR